MKHNVYYNNTLSLSLSPSHTPFSIFFLFSSLSSPFSSPPFLPFSPFFSSLFLSFPFSLFLPLFLFPFLFSFSLLPSLFSSFPFFLSFPPFSPSRFLLSFPIFGVRGAVCPPPPHWLRPCMLIFGKGSSIHLTTFLNKGLKSCVSNSKVVHVTSAQLFFSNQ